ncbi:hypothetical protein E2C01_089618 [Portunus trituberculatus]|uniref:Uncharacterized protein n=1 Tax=Portunus trituberculatus TaxID=210409 RepID=A0A5B7JMX7_PORTR|nr:hypothetical protein [Portunus trituberculatus]
MASINAWRDSNKVALRLLGTPPLEVTVTPPREVVFPVTSEQPDSNLVTVPPRVHGCHFTAGGCTDVVKESWIQLLVLVLAAFVSLSPAPQYEEVDLYFCSA